MEVHGHAAVTTSAGLIGYGGIAQDVVAALRETGDGVKFVGALCRPGRAAKARAALPGIPIVESLDDLLARGPDGRGRSCRPAER